MCQLVHLLAGLKKSAMVNSGKKNSAGESATKQRRVIFLLSIECYYLLRCMSNEK